VKARRHAALLTLGLAGCTMAEVPSPGARGTSASGSASRPVAQVESEIHALVNRHRARAGLAPLAYDERIAEIAREHSRAMASRRRSFGHADFDDRNRAISRVIPLRGMAENVAYDSRTGAQLVPSLVTGWINSPGHRRNIRGAYDLTGVGVARSADGVSYATQIFVKR